MSFFNPYIRISIHEFNGSHLRRSEAYAAVEAYLGRLGVLIRKCQETQSWDGGKQPLPQVVIKHGWTQTGEGCIPRGWRLVGFEQIGDIITVHVSRAREKILQAHLPQATQRYDNSLIWSTWWRNEDERTGRGSSLQIAPRIDSQSARTLRGAILCLTILQLLTWWQWKQRESWRSSQF